MRKVIPNNKVSHDYEKVLREFVSALKNRLGDILLMFQHERVQRFKE